MGLDPGQETTQMDPPSLFLFFFSIFFSSFILFSRTFCLSFLSVFLAYFSHQLCGCRILLPFLVSVRTLIVFFMLFSFHIVACTIKLSDQRGGMLIPEWNILRIARISILNISVLCYFHLQIVASTSETLRSNISQ